MTEEYPTEDEVPVYPPVEELAPDRSAFWPVALIASSLIVLIGWDLGVAATAHANGILLRDQQVKIVDQAKKVQADLEKLARDLIEVAGSDAEAKAIVTKYTISVNAPPAPAPAPAQ